MDCRLVDAEYLRDGNERQPRLVQLDAPGDLAVVHRAVARRDAALLQVRRDGAVVDGVSGRQLDHRLTRLIAIDNIPDLVWIEAAQGLLAFGLDLGCAEIGVVLKSKRRSNWCEGFESVAEKSTTDRPSAALRGG